MLAALPTEAQRRKGGPHSVCGETEDGKAAENSRLGIVSRRVGSRSGEVRAAELQGTGSRTFPASSLESNTIRKEQAIRIAGSALDWNALSIGCPSSEAIRETRRERCEPLFRVVELCATWRTFHGSASRMMFPQVLSVTLQCSCSKSTSDASSSIVVVIMSVPGEPIVQLLSHLADLSTSARARVMSAAPASVSSLIRQHGAMGIRLVPRRRRLQEVRQAHIARIFVVSQEVFELSSVGLILKLTKKGTQKIRTKKRIKKVPGQGIEP
ncbi:peroxisomal targeting signal receptor [Pseudozyma hubeiensis SY62]|uniref:Peroxisomal targeting signal receptor n=1 Tax=Pseudozyma hubeiensis (strain SY62) TaxID=1305764 RepID=R9PCW8_PSEHS|nr:peroxisomal targeting signal receptor [Pseudozyma hubeiensis SY62]GAC99206.1 peroxisomal targeting signal receptor [Pseudozyma hubeiensis SY62]